MKLRKIARIRKKDLGTGLAYFGLTVQKNPYLNIGLYNDGELWHGNIRIQAYLKHTPASLIQDDYKVEGLKQQQGEYSNGKD